MLNRRSFLKTGAAALPLSAALALDSAPLTAEASQASPLAALPPRLAPLDPATQPWQQRVRRVGQTNMTEHDPAVMNVEEWADYRASAGAQIVFVSVTGILAFYPSKVPFHRHGKFLGNRDFFGECVAAARKRGHARGGAHEPRPELGRRTGGPSGVVHAPPGRLRRRPTRTSRGSSRPACSPRYMDDYVPAIMREINSLYDVDCFYTNGWPPLGILPDCHCAICSKLPPTGTPAYWRAFNDRVFELWQNYDAIAKEKKPDSFFFANSGGNVRGGPNLDRLGKIARGFRATTRAAPTENPAVWGCTLQGRVCNAVMDGKFAANVTAAYSTGTVPLAQCLEES